LPPTDFNVEPNENVTRSGAVIEKVVPTVTIAGRLKVVNIAKDGDALVVIVCKFVNVTEVHRAIVVDQDEPRVTNAGSDKDVNTGAVELNAPVMVVKLVNVNVVTAPIAVLNAPPTVNNAGILIVVIADKALIVKAPVIEVNAGKLNVTRSDKDGVNAPEQVV
jgi:hypothetical protein